MVPDLSLSASGSGNDRHHHHHRHHHPPPVLSLGSFASSSSSPNVAPAAPYGHHRLHQPCVSPSGRFLPPWLATATTTAPDSVAGSSAPSVNLSLLPPEQPPPEMIAGRYFGLQQTAVLAQLCRELEEGRQNWIQHKKEANWRLSRLEKQLETEKTRKMREKAEEVEEEIRRLREDESTSLDRIDADCREQLNAILRDADAKEARMVEVWATKHERLSRLLEQMGSQGENSTVQQLDSFVVWQSQQYGTSYCSEIRLR